MSNQEETVLKLLAAAKAARSWGNVQIDFQDGDIVLVRETKTIKIQNGVSTTHQYGTRKY